MKISTAPTASASQVERLPGDTFKKPAGLMRLQSIDALRGFVMVLMLLDHLRETWFLHVPVADPIDATTALPALYLARLAASLCAPAFVLLRLANVYGDAPWFVVEHSPMRTAMSFFALTKYPPSLLFLLLTLGCGSLLLALFERINTGRVVPVLAVFGGAPMFFYLFHLSVLRLLYHAALAIWGATHGATFGVDDYSWVLLWHVGLIVPLYLPTVWFSRFKAARQDIGWLKYL